MSTKIVTLTVPAAPGFGPAADVSDLAGPKTVQLAGTFSGSYVVYASQDGTGYAPVLSFDAGGPEDLKQTLAGAFRFLKILSRTTSSSGVAASCSGLEDAAANTFVATTVAAGFSGVSPVEDLGLVNYQDDLCAIVAGAFDGELILEGSLDGTKFNPLGSWKSQGPRAGLLGPQVVEFSPLYVRDKVRYLRATLLGVTTQATTLSVGGLRDTTINPAMYDVLADLVAGIYAGDLDVRGNLTVTQQVATSGVPTALSVVSAAHTNLTASTEDVGVMFDLSATKTWAAGNIAFQREVVFRAPTYAFAAASTIAKATTVYIEGPPVAGANATITAPAALVVAAGRVGIGFDSPGYTLEVRSAYGGAGAGVNFVGSNPSGEILRAIDGARGLVLTGSGAGEVALTCVGDAAAGLIINQSVSGPIIFKTNNATVGQWDALGNLAVGAGSAGATAAKTLALTNAATAPSVSADLAHLYCADVAAGRATLATWSEEAPAADVGLASTHSYTEFINGVKYKRMLVLVP